MPAGRRPRLPRAKAPRPPRVAAGASAGAAPASPPTRAAARASPPRRAREPLRARFFSFIARVIVPLVAARASERPNAPSRPLAERSSSSLASPRSPREAAPPSPPAASPAVDADQLEVLRVRGVHARPGRRRRSCHCACSCRAANSWGREPASRVADACISAETVAADTAVPACALQSPPPPPRAATAPPRARAAPPGSELEGWWTRRPAPRLRLRLGGFEHLGDGLLAAAGLGARGRRWPQPALGAAAERERRRRRPCPSGAPRAPRTRVRLGVRLLQPLGVVVQVGARHSCMRCFCSSRVLHGLHEGAVLVAGVEMPACTFVMSRSRLFILRTASA